MEANIEEPLTLAEIAEYVGVSRRQLERLFHDYLHLHAVAVLPRPQAASRPVVAAPDRHEGGGRGGAMRFFHGGTIREVLRREIRQATERRASRRAVGNATEHGFGMSRCDHSRSPSRCVLNARSGAICARRQRRVRTSVERRRREREHDESNKDHPGSPMRTLRHCERRRSVRPARVPINLRQSGPTPVGLLISTRVRKSPFWHLSVGSRLLACDGLQPRLPPARLRAGRGRRRDGGVRRACQPCHALECRGRAPDPGQGSGRGSLRQLCDHPQREAHQADACQVRDPVQRGGRRLE